MMLQFNDIRKVPTSSHILNSISIIAENNPIQAFSKIQESLDLILAVYPRIHQLHPLYIELFKIFLHPDHYLLALDRITRVAKKLQDIHVGLKTTSPLCQKSFHQALNRAQKLITQLDHSLSYLEQVRINLISKLPRLNPDTRFLLMYGYNNDESSVFFPLQFPAVQSLFIGQVLCHYITWRVINACHIFHPPREDFPPPDQQLTRGICQLPTPFIFLLDISESCDKSIAQQIDLVKSLYQRFKADPLMLVLNQLDICSDSMTPDQRELISETVAEHNCATHIMCSSSVAMKAASYEQLS